MTTTTAAVLDRPESTTAPATPGTAMLTTDLADATARPQDTTRHLDELTDAHQRLADGVRQEMTTIVNRRALGHRDANTVLARLGLPALPAPVTLRRLIFRVPVRITVCADLPHHARPAARELIAVELGRLRGVNSNTPRIVTVNPRLGDHLGRTRFEVHAVVWLSVDAAGRNGQNLWPAARATLTAELARLRAVRFAGVITQAEEHRLNTFIPHDSGHR
jgi:hypothetical protein